MKDHHLTPQTTACLIARLRLVLNIHAAILQGMCARYTRVFIGIGSGRLMPVTRR